MPSSSGLVVIAVGIAVETLGLVVFGVALALAGLLRAQWWAKVCATSQLVTTASTWCGCTGAIAAKPWPGLTCGTCCSSAGHVNLCGQSGQDQVDRSHSFWSILAPIRRLQASAISLRS